MRIVENIKYSNYDECQLDMYLPNEKGFKTICYFHGGGLESGNKSDWSYSEIGKSFARHGYGFVSCNYRMYPNAKFPDYLYDAANAVKYVKENITKFGGNGKIIISGQSAGAWITLMLMVNKEYLNSVSIEPTEILGWISDSSQCTSHFNILEKERHLSPYVQRIDEIAPLYYVDQDLGFTKLLLIYYTKDMPNRLEQNLLFKRSILTFNKDADIEDRLLEGGHCEGSGTKDPDGEFPYVKVSLDWLNRKGL